VVIICQNVLQIDFVVSVCFNCSTVADLNEKLNALEQQVSVKLQCEGTIYNSQGPWHLIHANVLNLHKNVLKILRNEKAA